MKLDNERNIIPRWREFSKTAQLGELSSIRAAEKKVTYDKVDLSNKYQEWDTHRTLPYAADLVASSFALGCYDYAHSAAEFILSNESASDFAKDIARKIVFEELPTNVCTYEDRLYNRKTKQQRVNYLRNLLTADPHNSIAWTDMAREYTMLGELIKAKRAIEIALNLSPENRFILRSACRLFHHIDDPGRALYILRKSSLVRNDPWIMAAEIASSVVAGKNSGLIRSGMAMVSDKDFHPLHITELSGALGTIELHNGENRSSRKLFLRSLESPNDNSFAQAVWASKIISSLDTEETLKKKDIPCVYEAHSIKLLRYKDWEGALKETELWLDDQPFSRFPAILGSYLAADVVGDYIRAVEIAKMGLEANPNDNTIINNLTFSLASIGQIQEAEQYFSRINLSDTGVEMKTVWHATKGLIAFRKGLYDEGRELYRKAIEIASGKDYKDYREAAAVYWAREELLANTIYSSEAVVLASQECADTDNEFHKVLFERLIKLYEEKRDQRDSGSEYSLV